jgi:hypothetical protein
MKEAATRALAYSSLVFDPKDGDDMLLRNVE